MCLPGFADFINVFYDKFECFGKLPLIYPKILCKCYFWLYPKLSFPLGSLHMNVHSWFFTREKIESEWSTAKDCWAHWSMLFAIPPGINKCLLGCLQ